MVAKKNFNENAYLNAKNRVLSLTNSIAKQVQQPQHVVVDDIKSVTTTLIKSQFDILETAIQVTGLYPKAQSELLATLRQVSSNLCQDLGSEYDARLEEIATQKQSEISTLEETFQKNLEAELETSRFKQAQAWQQKLRASVSDVKKKYRSHLEASLKQQQEQLHEYYNSQFQRISREKKVYSVQRQCSDASTQHSGVVAVTTCTSTQTSDNNSKDTVALKECIINLNAKISQYEKIVIPNLKSSGSTFAAESQHYKSLYQNLWKAFSDQQLSFTARRQELEGSAEDLRHQNRSLESTIGSLNESMRDVEERVRGSIDAKDRVIAELRLKLSQSVKKQHQVEEMLQDLSIV